MGHKIEMILSVSSPKVAKTIKEGDITSQYHGRYRIETLPVYTSLCKESIVENSESFY